MIVNFVKVSRNDLKIFGFDLLYQYPFAVFFCVVIVLSGLHKTYAAPTHIDDENSWWKDSCSVQLRHGRSPSESQLRIFFKKYDETIVQRLLHLYRHGPKHKQKGNCSLKVGKLMKPIREAKNTTMATKYFYGTMIQIAQYMTKLKNVKINTPANFNVSERENLFNFAKYKLRLVLCEFNETLERWNETTPKVKPINPKCLAEPMDYTSIQLRDTDFFNKLKKFINQSLNTLKKLKRKQKKSKKHEKEKKKKQ